MQESSSVASSNDVVTCFGTSCEASDSSQEEAIERAEATLGIVRVNWLEPPCEVS
jgi:flavin-binding protein dodecin